MYSIGIEGKCKDVHKTQPLQNGYQSYKVVGRAGVSSVQKPRVARVLSTEGSHGLGRVLSSK